MRPQNREAIGISHEDCFLKVCIFDFKHFNPSNMIPIQRGPYSRFPCHWDHSFRPLTDTGLTPEMTRGMKRMSPNGVVVIQAFRSG